MPAQRSTIERDVTAALKAGDAVRAGRLRLLRAALKNAEIEKRAAHGEPRPDGQGELTEQEVGAIVRREVKRHDEAIAAFEKGGRADLVSQERAEREILAAYLPAAPSGADIERAVTETIAAGTAGGFGPVMGAVMKRLGGAADGAAVAAAVKTALAKQT